MHALLTASLLVLASANSPPPGKEAAPPAHAQSRREVIRAVVGQSVRVWVYDGDRARRAASGVVIASRPSPHGGESFIVTNAHVVTSSGLAHEQVKVLVDHGAKVSTYPARVLAEGRVPQMDLALLEVEGAVLPAATLGVGDDLELGARVLVSAAPYGKDLSLSSGIISQVQYDPDSGRAKMLKTDAPIGYGASGGGIFSLSTGRLLAVVEGYRTAKVDFSVDKQQFSFDVPMPGETFASPTPKLQWFLAQHGFAKLTRPATAQTAQADAQN